MARMPDGGRAESYEEMFLRFAKDNLSIRVDSRSEYGSGNSKRLEVQLLCNGKIISEDAVYITEGKYESSW